MDAVMRIEKHDLHGTGECDCYVFPMPGTGWDAVTDVPCPVEGCDNTVLWYEAGYVPGYRVCMPPTGKPNTFRVGEIRHRFLAGHDLTHPTLILDGERP
jgi:hypothetical protein